LVAVSPEQLVLAQQFLDMLHNEQGMESTVTCSHASAVFPGIASPCNWTKIVQVSVIGLQREPWPAFEVRTTGSLEQNVRHGAHIDDRLWA